MIKWLLTLASIGILFSGYAFNEKDIIGKWVEVDHSLLFGFDETDITIDGKKSQPQLVMEFTETNMFYKTNNMMGSVFFIQPDSSLELFSSISKTGGLKEYKIIDLSPEKLVIEELYKSEDKGRAIVYRYVMKRYIGTKSIEDIYAGDVKPVPVFSFVDEQPEYIGGETAKADFIQKNLKGVSPQKLFLTIVIDTLGNVSSVKYLKRISYADAVIITKMLRKMPRWKPGRNKGNLVNASMTMSISIK